jgi:hypothetical protein
MCIAVERDGRDDVDGYARLGRFMISGVRHN